jgi:dihydroorotate dehydrogenase
LINRLGFNNDGLDIVSKRISSNSPNRMLGINIGPNKDTKNKIDDFSICLLELHSKAHYITINISSPNTEGLRDFHEKDSLSKLLENLTKIKKSKKIQKPLLLKISPDINSKDISQINELIFKYNLDGIILSNTTDNNRDNLEDVRKNEKGGLSGLPLKDISTEIIKKFYKETKGKVPIVGVGGIDSGKSAFEKIIAGADVVQLYTGMIYNGPGVVKKIKKELIDILKKENIKNIDQAVGISS